MMVRTHVMDVIWINLVVVNKMKYKNNKTITVIKYDWVNHMTLKPGKKVRINIKNITNV